MKKTAVFLLLLLSVFSFAACNKVNKEESAITQKITESVINIVSTTQSKKSSVTISAVASEEHVILNKNDSDYIINILKTDSWDDGTADCLNDYAFEFDGKTIYYHCDCGTFNDNKASKSLSVSDNEKSRITEIINNNFILKCPVSDFDKEKDSSEASQIHLPLIGDAINTYSAEKDGLLLTVYSPSLLVYGNELYVTATIKNTTDKDITYTLPYCVDDTHTEIRVKITDGKNYFTDLDIHGKAFPEMTKTVTLQSGETYTQKMRFSPCEFDWFLIDYPDESIKYFDAGDYTGTATFYWHEADDPSKSYSVSLDFPVTIVNIRSQPMIEETGN